MYEFIKEMDGTCEWCEMKLYSEFFNIYSTNPYHIMNNNATLRLIKSLITFTGIINAHFICTHFQVLDEIITLLYDIFCTISNSILSILKL